MRKTSLPGNARAYIGEYRTKIAVQTNQVPGPFGVNPIRRSFIGATVSLTLITTPFLISEQAGASVMLSVGWIALAVVIFCVPVFLMSVGEELVRIVTHRVHPPVSDLDLSERVVHILQRHGVHTIQAAQRLDPASLHLMANMGSRDVQAVHRALNLWHYRRWQDAGFPAEGGD